MTLFSGRLLIEGDYSEGAELVNSLFFLASRSMIIVSPRRTTRAPKNRPEREVLGMKRAIILAAVAVALVAGAAMTVLTMSPQTARAILFPAELPSPSALP